MLFLVSFSTVKVEVFSQKGLVVGTATLYIS